MTSVVNIEMQRQNYIFINEDWWTKRNVEVDKKNNNKIIHLFARLNLFYYFCIRKSESLPNHKVDGQKCG